MRDTERNIYYYIAEAKRIGSQYKDWTRKAASVTGAAKLTYNRRAEHSQENVSALSADLVLNFSLGLKATNLGRICLLPPQQQPTLFETMRFNQHFNGCCRTIYDFERLSSYPSGPKGRGFESCHLEHKRNRMSQDVRFLCDLNKSVQARG